MRFVFGLTDLVLNADDQWLQLQANLVEQVPEVQSEGSHLLFLVFEVLDRLRSSEGLYAHRRQDHSTGWHPSYVGLKKIFRVETLVYVIPLVDLSSFFCSHPWRHFEYD